MYNLTCVLKLLIDKIYRLLCDICAINICLVHTCQFCATIICLVHTCQFRTCVFVFVSSFTGVPQFDCPSRRDIGKICGLNIGIQGRFAASQGSAILNPYLTRGCNNSYRRDLLLGNFGIHRYLHHFR